MDLNPSSFTNFLMIFIFMQNALINFSKNPSLPRVLVKN